ncbi:uncharacterized protein N7459_001378 [Penicillium hispanicum]|uniref:uncharacterized protein n=1 Tax=Penicillium hispanicum TaxID=1080232 RepID=UPI00253FBE87|nr:uncharacterized protein N7459_001378 [Penicillium hispanicum]KAJ5595170.1 hypothetical protein N7459_001378 [Penicillium hispanicum]
MPSKRACDTCIVRKVKCNGSWPCNTCRDAVKRVPCTYLRPVRKRGPKARRRTPEDQEQDDDPQRLPPDQPEGLAGTRSEQIAARHEKRPFVASANPCLPHRISKVVLAPILRLYQQYSYGVWPVVNADALLQKIENVDPEDTPHESENIACLGTALCAATMAQLHLPPVANESYIVDSTAMAQACLRIRGRCDSHREHLDISGILVSFFLHVYHAKMNQRTSAMMYIQEAISGARILRLDEPSSNREGSHQSGMDSVLIANKELVFPLLWVSERGYALHLGLSPSYIDPPSLEALENGPVTDIHVQGLLDLVGLFIAFDQISVRRKAHVGITSPIDLTDTEEKLSSLILKLADQVSTRTADCHITREWMRTILWQEALSSGFLSSSTCTKVMTFEFPAEVGRDLLHSLRCFSDSDLLPLGRDQLLKCFEVANSLADTVLLNPARSQSGFELGPHDFLHGLYQKLIPFLEQDTGLKSILRTKTAEILVMAPARLLTLQISGSGTRGTLPQVTDKVHTYNAQSSQIRQQNDVLAFDNLFPDRTWPVDTQVSL